MKYVYAGIAILAILFGVILYAGAPTAAQQIEAFIMFVVGGVFMVAAEVSELTQRLSNISAKINPPASPPER